MLRLVRVRYLVQFYKDTFIGNKKSFFFLFLTVLLGAVLGVISAITKNEALIENSYYFNYVAEIAQFNCSFFTLFLHNIVWYVVMYALLYLSCFNKYLVALIFLSLLYYTFRIFRGIVIMLIFCGFGGVFSAIFFYALILGIFLIFYFLAAVLALDVVRICPCRKLWTIQWELLFLFILSSLLIFFASAILFLIFSIAA